jgi:DNA-binding NarL/FixJ family response regulator
MKPAKVLIADANAKLAQVIADLLGDEPGYTVVGVVDSGAAALLAARRRHPSVVLVDPKLTDTTGVALCAALRAAAPDATVLLWSHGTDRPQDGIEVDGLLERGMTFRELVHAMDAAQAETAAGGERRPGTWSRLAESNRGQPHYE